MAQRFIANIDRVAKRLFRTGTLYLRSPKNRIERLRIGQD